MLLRSRGSSRNDLDIGLLACHVVELDVGDSESILVVELLGFYTSWMHSYRAKGNVFGVSGGVTAAQPSQHGCEAKR